MSGWDLPNEAEFRAEERERRRWWAENFPPDRGAAPPRCRRRWLGVCRRLGQDYDFHECARPVNHHQGRYRICMCYCGDKNQERAPVMAVAAPLPLGSGQGALFDVDGAA